MSSRTKYEYQVLGPSFEGKAGSIKVGIGEKVRGRSRLSDHFLGPSESKTSPDFVSLHASVSYLFNFHSANYSFS